jgi:hypothetical protein
MLSGIDTLNAMFGPMSSCYSGDVSQLLSQYSTTVLGGHDNTSSDTTGTVYETGINQYIDQFTTGFSSNIPVFNYEDSSSSNIASAQSSMTSLTGDLSTLMANSGVPINTNNSLLAGLAGQTMTAPETAATYSAIATQYSEMTSLTGDLSTLMTNSGVNTNTDSASLAGITGQGLTSSDMAAAYSAWQTSFNNLQSLSATYNLNS